MQPDSMSQLPPYSAKRVKLESVTQQQCKDGRQGCARPLMRDTGKEHTRLACKLRN